MFVCLFILFNHGIKCPRSAKKAVFQRGREYSHNQQKYMQKSMKFTHKKTRTITQKYQTQIKYYTHYTTIIILYTLYNDYTHEITNTQTHNQKIIMIHKTIVQAMP